MSPPPSRTRIVIGQTPTFEGTGRYFDGVTPVARRAELSVHEGPGLPMLVIRAPGTAEARWPLEDIRRLPDQADRGEWVLGLAENPLARLIVTEDETRRVLKIRAKDLTRRPALRGGGKIAAWAVAAVAAVALIVMVLVPRLADQLAVVLPAGGERGLGEATYEQVRRALAPAGLEVVAICEGGPGQAALERMAARVADGAVLPAALKVSVLDHPMVNAVALPGGHVVLFRGLIDAAEDPDEVAAVLAHEIGHVAARDPTRMALRSAGTIGVLGLLLGDFAGGTVVLFLTERLIFAAYSREVETAADSYARARLREVGLPREALGRFFTRMVAKDDAARGLVRHFATHPELAERIAASDHAGAAHGEGAAAHMPSLSPEAWADLRAICEAS